VFSHVDPLDALNRSLPLGDKLAALHGALRGELPFIDRIAVAAYDPATDLLETFLASPHEPKELVRYEARLADSPSLAEIARSHRPRVVNDLEVFRAGERHHTRVIAAQGHRSSYTVPMLRDGAFWGLVFFDSRTAGALTEPVLKRLDAYAHLVSALVITEELSARLVAAVVKTAHDFVHLRDPETGGHIDRMARYARLIAQHLAATGAVALDDADVETIFEFAPLHDIGKIAVPDRILLKPADLTAEERAEMEAHTVRGREMVDAIARNFGLGQPAGLDVLRHIAESHHEAIDGSGYPHQLHGDEIPLEARIVAVADAFDALTTARPYKPAWTNEQAFAWLRGAARSKFDQRCVEALAAHADKVAEIQARFRDADVPPA
jgi:HD-GYP domain-containing protein (c-di-GMP phosphodiesterase class II)